MMQALHYPVGGLPPVSAHSLSKHTGDNPEPRPLAPSSGHAFYQHHHQPMDDSHPRVMVKEEPEEMEDEEEKAGMVIDLTPRSAVHGSTAQPRKNYTEASVRHHPYYRPAPEKDDSVSGPQGNVPSHLHSMDSSSGYSDTDSSSHDRGGKMDGKRDMVTGTFHFSIDQDSLTSIGGSQPRAKREFVPNNKKDGQYWNKRHKNNLSARKSRIKRKTMEKLMEHRMVELQQENIKLRHELNALKRMFGDKISTDLTSSPAGSPASSSSSSGIGTSNSSSGGSADHSTSSSPALQIHEDKPKKAAAFKLKVKLAAQDSEHVRDDVLDRHHSGPFSTVSHPSSGCASPSGRNTRDALSSVPNISSAAEFGESSPPPPPTSAHNIPGVSAPGAHRVSLPTGLTVCSGVGPSRALPPVAHTHRNSPPASQAGSYLDLQKNPPPVAHGSSSAHDHFFVQNRSAYASPCFATDLTSSATGTSFLSPNNTHFTEAYSDRHRRFAQAFNLPSATREVSESLISSPLLQNPRLPPPSPSPSRSDSSPDPVGSPEGVLSSEEDVSLSGSSRRNSGGSLDGKAFHKFPLKCRMKRELHSAFNPTNLTLHREEVASQ